jgi:hypothetical protein
MPQQKWECEKCKKTGSVEYEKGADVMTVVHQLGDDHQLVSPKCDQPTGMLRIVRESKN